jgi:hypothetical protein
VGRAGGADDRGGDGGVVQEPGECDLGGGDVALARELDSLRDDFGVARLVVEAVLDRVALRASGRVVAVCGAGE